MTRVLLVRHAQSEWNAAGRWQGWADPPLSAQGRLQAEQAGARLRRLAPPITAVVSSDLDRARTTARIIAGIAGSAALAAGLAAGPERVDARQGLRELDVGRWSGLTADQIATAWPDLLAGWRSGALDAAPGGEARSRFDARVQASLAEVLADHAGEHLLVVAHGGVVRSVARWLGASDRATRHVAGFWIDHQSGRAEIGEAVDLLEEAGETRTDPPSGPAGSTPGREARDNFLP